jgi:hypothetical protein
MFKSIYRWSGKSGKQNATSSDELFMSSIIRQKVGKYIYLYESVSYRSEKNISHLISLQYPLTQS